MPATKLATSRTRPLPPTRAGAVADELRRMIQAGELAPGERLRQVEIAKRFGVSTTPVREAFTALAREGLVRQDAHRGAIVFSPSLDELRENYEIRIALEPLATEIATRQLTEEQLERLRSHVRGMAKTRDADRYLDLNRAFHAEIYAAANRPRLVELIENFRDAASAYLGLLGGWQDPIFAAEAQEQHEAILEALVARAPKRAAKLMAQHLEHSASQIARQVAGSDAPA